jgi:hypothetical protein
MKSFDDQQHITALYEREMAAGMSIPERSAVLILALPPIEGDETIERIIADLKELVAKGNNLIQQLQPLLKEKKRRSPEGQQIGLMLKALEHYLREANVPVPEFDIAEFVDAQAAYKPGCVNQPEALVIVGLESNSHEATMLLFYATEEGWRIDIMGNGRQLRNLSVELLLEGTHPSM